MKKPYDLTGFEYGRLKPIIYSNGRWLCRCDCGGEAWVKPDNLKSGHTQSCGCLQRERASQARTKHRLAGTGAYNSWASMKARCGNPANPAFKNYGGRGITFDPAWETFDGFFADMGPRPPGTSLDRIDNEGGYNKNNCRWATQAIQSNNTRVVVRLEFRGETRSIAQWSRSLGWHPSKLSRRIKRGWSIERSLTTP